MKNLGQRSRDLDIVDKEDLDKKRIYYGTSNTANGTNEKVVTTVDGNFKLEAGAVIFVEFRYKCSGSPAYLKVDNTTATQVATLSVATGTYNIWADNEVVGFVYDGTYFVCFGRKTASTSNYGLTFLTTSATEDIEYTSATPASINRLAQYMLSGASVYSASSTYAVGDKCRRGYYIYVCNTAITTAEAWNANHWTVLPSFQDQLDSIKEDLETHIVTDFQVNGTSVVSSKVGNIVTNTAYNASSNKIATMSDVPAITSTDVTIDEQDSLGFVVTITFSESEISDKQAVYVYDGTDTSGTLVFSDTNSRTATPPATVSCSTGHLYIRCVGTAEWINDVITNVTGSITSAYAGSGAGGPLLITVNSSGSFTMSVDYDF